MGRIEQLIARRHIQEMALLESLIDDLGSWAETEVVSRVELNGVSYPLYCVSIGCKDPSAPVLAFFAGVHGLEKIGSEVLLAYLQTVAELVRWDKSYQHRLESSRVVFMPIVNPTGIKLRRRSNKNGVDLMRNSPLDGEPGSPLRLYRGHRYTPMLPWYRGVKGQEMEVEAQALCRVVREKLFSSQLSLAVDVHSGFGATDRLWFPYAHSKAPFSSIAEVYALQGLFERSYPRHPYVIEPTSGQYTIHGDLWDYLSLEFDNNPDYKGRLFLPWTLEMGSWLWLRKNPMQIFSRLGLFHPIQAHRMKRTLRRHNTLFDFLHRSVISPVWRKEAKEKREILERKSYEKWYS